MDLTTLKTIKEVSSKFLTDQVISNYLEKGWMLVETRKVREVQEDGGFADEVIYILGHTSENA